MLEVLLLCEYPTLNGGERSMLSVLDGVRAAGLTVVAVAPPEGPLAEELTRRNVEVLPFIYRGADGRRQPMDMLRERLTQMLSSRRPALLHANSLSMGRLSGPIAERLRLPSVAHLRDIIKLSRRAVADLNCHGRLLAVSEATRKFHVLGGVAAEKTHVLYNGVNLEEFLPRRPTGYLHRELDLPDKTALIGTIGQLGLRKGQDVLLRAAAAIVRRAPDVHYIIVGERNSGKAESRRFERELHEVADGSLAGRVHFLGRRDDVPSLLNELTMLVHPARQEPLGRVLLEAAAAGTPIVATDVGGAREIFGCDFDFDSESAKHSESQAARLVGVDDSSGLAAAVVELVEDARLRDRLAIAARRRVETHFDARTAADKLLVHYRAAISCSADQ